MVPSVWLLLLAIVLLWLPRSWLRLGPKWASGRRRSGESRGSDPSQDPADGRIHFRREIGRLRNHLDLLRAAAGGLILAGFPGFESALSRFGFAPSTRELVVRGAVLLVGLLIQTVRWERGRLTFYPPVFYVGGIMFGLVSPLAALFAFILAWAVSPLLSPPAAFLTVHAGLVLVFSQVFAGGGLLPALVGASLGFLPVLLSLLAGKPLQLLSPRPARTT